MASFDLSIVLSGEFRDWLVQGFLLSIRLALVTLALAFPLSIVVALLRLAPYAAARAAGRVYVEGIRNVPLLVHMLFLYFGAPQLLPEVAREWLYEHNAESACAVVALTLYTAAFMSEDVRSGIRSIPTAQMEAGRALGLTFLGTMRQVILPQATRITVPPLISQSLNLWKNTSIATVIGTMELMYQAQRVESASFRGAETFAVTTLAYLTVSVIITAIGGIYRRRFPVAAT